MEDSIPKRCDMAHPGYQDSPHRCVGLLMLRHRKVVGSCHGPNRAPALRSRFPPSLWKTAVIKDSAPLVSLRQWRPAGVLVFDRPSATETAWRGSGLRDAPFVCWASLTPGEEGMASPRRWSAGRPRQAQSRQNRAYSHDPAVLFKIASGEPKGQGKEWAGKNRS
jgi:hypothetical protein